MAADWSALMIMNDLGGLGSLRIDSNELLPATTGNEIKNPPPDEGDLTFKIDFSTDYEVGDGIVIDEGGSTEEVAIIKTIGGGGNPTITATLPLLFDHATNDTVKEWPKTTETRLDGQTEVEVSHDSAERRTMEAALQACIDNMRTCLSI